MRIEQLLPYITHDRVVSEIILADILEKDRSFLFAHPEYKIPDPKLDKIKSRIERMNNHEPLAYILGYKEFYGLKFFVDKRVMIPRHDTEELVDQVLNYVRSRISTKPIKICDVGTGGGCIAITLANKLPQAKIYATDISKKALNVAKKNAKYHNVENVVLPNVTPGISTFSRSNKLSLENKITFLKGDLLNPLPERVDVIVANLPYIKTAKISQLDTKIYGWEPIIALDGGEDGKSLYNQLFSQASYHLKTNGIIFYEIDGKIYIKTFKDLRDT